MRMNGAETLVRSLEACGINTLFGIPGVHNNPVYAALARSSIRHIVTRHEQGAGFMADGYARVTGRVGTCLVTGGPGVTNAATAAGQAFSDSSPVLIISTQNERAYADKCKGCAHEAKDQRAVMGGLCAWSARADSPLEILRLVRLAFHQMMTERPRSIHIEIPVDVLDEEAEIAPALFAAMARDLRPAHFAAVRGDLEQLSRLMAEARAPLWILGGGAAGASEVLLRILDRCPAPVATTVAGKGTLPDDHPLVVGCRLTSPALSDTLAECDLAIAVGTSLASQDTAHFRLPLPQRLVHIDIDPANIDLNYPGELAFVGDAARVLTGLEALLAERRVDRSGELRARHEQVAALRQRAGEVLQSTRAPVVLSLLNELRDALPREAIFFSDMTLVAATGMEAMPVYSPRSYLYPQGYATLGFSFPAALGAKLALPDRPVVAMSGDGGFLFSAQELATAVQYRIPVPVIVFNDNAYGSIRRDQAQRYGVELGVQLHNPDFTAFGHAFGARAARVLEPARLGAVLREALAADGPTLIEVPLKV